jgi:hypothetical protein
MELGSQEEVKLASDEESGNEGIKRESDEESGNEGIKHLENREHEALEELRRIYKE